MQDEERRRMVVKRTRKLRKLRDYDSSVEGGDYAELNGRMNRRLQRFRKTMIEDTLPDNESDS